MWFSNTPKGTLLVSTYRLFLSGMPNVIIEPANKATQASMLYPGLGRPLYQLCPFLFSDKIAGGGIADACNYQRNLRPGEVIR